MFTEVLYQLLLTVSIVACVFLIFVFWRLYRILTDVNVSTEKLSKTVDKATVVADSIIDSLKEFKDLISGFLASFKTVKDTKDKIIQILDEQENKK